LTASARDVSAKLRLIGDGGDRARDGERGQVDLAARIAQIGAAIRRVKLDDLLREGLR
jgi:hypothetical protein